MNFIFKENQKFKQWWLWGILLYLPIRALIPFEKDEINGYYILIGFVLPVIFYFIQLRIKVSKEGLHYQFFPLHLKLYTIKMEEIESFQAMKYSPLKEYGGWGIKYGFKGKAYNISGNKGVRVFLKNGSNVMFGSQKHEELASALQVAKRQ